MVARRQAVACPGADDPRANDVAAAVLPWRTDEDVVHAAAVLDFASFPDRKRRERSHQVNVGGVENIVAAAVEANVKRLV